MHHPLTKQSNGQIIGRTEILMADSSAIDAFARLRTATPVSIFENKNIHDRSPSQWEEPIEGAIINHGAVTSGPFQVAETITGGTSGIIGTVTVVGAGSLTYTVNHNDFIDGETITGGTSGATATVTDHDTGSDVSHDRDTASVILQVGSSSGDKATRQTHRYFSYIPGKSHEIWLTFNFGTATENLARRSGYFNGDNGIFLEQTSLGIRWIVRSATTGSPVDTAVEQADWNLDSLDGTSNSEINLDFTKSQFLLIDMQWQGDGRVRVGFFHHGQIVYCHEFLFSNTLSSVYMSTPSLPVKHEIENIGTTSGSNTMREICTSIVSMGGEKPNGLGFSVSNDVTGRTINNGSESPVIAIRLKNTHPAGGPNRVVVQFTNLSFFATGNSSHFELTHIHDSTSITATWNDVSDDSAVEYSTDISAISGGVEHNIEEGYVAAGQAGKGASPGQIQGDIADQHRFLTQNFDSTNSEIFVIFGEAVTGNADGYGHINWVEFD